MAVDAKYELKAANEVSKAVGFLRRRSKAQIVLVIRAADVSVSIDENIQPIDAVTGIRNELPRLLQYLIDRRAKRKG